jgi:hypothetical protein
MNSYQHENNAENSPFEAKPVSRMQAVEPDAL